MFQQTQFKYEFSLLTVAVAAIGLIVLGNIFVLAFDIGLASGIAIMALIAIALYVLQEQFHVAIPQMTVEIDLTPEPPVVEVDESALVEPRPARLEAPPQQQAAARGPVRLWHR